MSFILLTGRVSLEHLPIPPEGHRESASIVSSPRIWNVPLLVQDLACSIPGVPARPPSICSDSQPIALDIIRFILITFMAVVVFTGTVQMWMLYLFGLGFGLVAGFAIPAGNSTIPMLVDVMSHEDHTRVKNMPQLSMWQPLITLGSL